jgi:hypothetical protein
MMLLDSVSEGGPASVQTTCPQVTVVPFRDTVTYRERGSGRARIYEVLAVSLKALSHMRSTAGILLRGCCWMDVNENAPRSADEGRSLA